MKKKLAALLAALLLISTLGGAIAVEPATATPDAPQQVQTVPFPTGINVSLNGRYLALDGVAPLNAGGHTMVPFRAFLEAFGATVNYGDGKITAALKSGDQLELNLKSTVMDVTHDGKTTSTDIGVAPYTQDGRNYIPARAVGELLGLNVAWDKEDQMVYLTDWNALKAELDQNFKTYNELLAIAQASEKKNSEKTYASTADLSVKVTLDETAATPDKKDDKAEEKDDKDDKAEKQDGKDDKAEKQDGKDDKDDKAEKQDGKDDKDEKKDDATKTPLKGTGSATLHMDALSNKDAMSADVKLDLDLGTLKTALTALLGQETIDKVSTLKGSTAQIIGNITTGELYLKSDLPAKIGMNTIDGNSWYHIQPDVTDTAAATAQLTKLMGMAEGQTMTVGSLVVGCQSMLGQLLSDMDTGTDADMDDPYEQAVFLGQAVGIFFGDDVLVKKVAGDVTTYSADLDMAKITARLLKAGIVDKEDIAEMMKGAAAPVLGLKFSAAVKAGKLDKMDMSCTVKVAGDDPMEMNMMLTGNDKVMTMTVDVKAEGVAVALALDLKSAETAKTVPSAPPKGEKVLETK